MKKIFFVLSALIPMLALADIIVKKDSQTIEDVTIVTMTADNVVYKQEGTTKTIASSEVDGVLYDNGRFVTPPSKQAVQASQASTSNEVWSVDDGSNGNADNQNRQESYDNASAGREKEISILAYGKPVMGFYSADHAFDGVKVEYRVVTKYNPNPEFEYLGTTPFAYLTEAELKVLSSMDKKNVGIFEIRPLIVESGGNAEFRLSKEGYRTVVVKPMVKIDFGGRIIMLPLNQLKR